MILYTILAGLYAIGAAGYYKISKKTVFADDSFDEIATLVKALLVVMSLVWPLGLYWGIVKEAVRQDGS